MIEQNPTPTIDGSKGAPSILGELRRRGIWKEGTPLRLHLGCGEQHMEGYVNIDYPQENHNVQKPRPDFEADILDLEFPRGSVDEVRLHHVFEHFTRVRALALLIRWREWLRPGGILLIETPDLVGSARTILAPDRPWWHKTSAIRHLAGDQADRWAFHVDHWFPERFQRTLTAMGFEDVRTESVAWTREPHLCNVVATARRSAPDLGRAHQKTVAEEILKESMVAPAEEPMLRVWMRELDEFLATHPGRPAKSGVRLVVFSKDRPYQLDGLLHSMRAHVRDWSEFDLDVLYTTSDADNQAAYAELVRGFGDWPRLNLRREGLFRDDLLDLLEGGEQVLFLVDDAVFTASTSIADAVDLLRKRPDILGVSFRLGGNSRRCYPLGREQKMPAFTSIGGDRISWNWTDADADFGYPLEVSSSLYRVEDLLPILRGESFAGPNSLEDALSRSAVSFRTSRPLLAGMSVAPAFAIPANVVQSTHRNRHGKKSDARTLLQAWKAGLRMDIDALRGVVSDGAHMDWNILPKGFSASSEGSLASKLVAKFRALLSRT